MIATAAALLMQFLHAGEDWVRFSEDGSRILVEANGVTEMKGSFMVDYSLDGRRASVDSMTSTLLEPVQQSIARTPCGDAVVSTATDGAKESPCQYPLTLKRLMGLRNFTLQGVFHHRGDKDCKVHFFDLLNTTTNRGGNFAVANAAEWLATPLMAAREPMPPIHGGGELLRGGDALSTRWKGFFGLPGRACGGLYDSGIYQRCLYRQRQDGRRAGGGRPESS